MRLEHSFTVPAPVEVAWQALLDPARVAPCFPGATLTGVTGDEFTGNVKVRMGPVSLLYKGTGRFASVDEDAHRLVLEATGKDSRGNGTASATVTATVAGSAEGTKVDVLTDLIITGRPAQLGRGLIAEVGGKIIDAFAGCLATELGGAGQAAGPATSAGSISPNGAASRSASAATAGPVATSTPGSTAGSTATPTATPPPAAAATSTSTQTTTQSSTQTPASRPRPVSSAEEIDLINLAGQPVLKRLAPVLIAALAVLLVLRWLRRRG